MVIKFDPAGRVAMVFGRKQEASDEGTAPLKHPKPPLPPVDGMFRQVTDIAWDAGRQRLHQRRLHQFARRQGRTRRRLARIVGHAGRRPGAVQHAAQHRGRCAGTTSMSPTAATAASRCSTATGNAAAHDHHRRAVRSRRQAGDRQQAHPAAATRHAQTMAPGAPWAICITPGPNQVLYSADAYPGRIYKLTLDGKVLGVLGSVRQAAEAIRLDPRDGVPVGEHAVRRRAAELAGAETDPASGEVASPGQVGKPAQVSKKVAALCSAAKFREETSKKQNGGLAVMLRRTICTRP